VEKFRAYKLTEADRKIRAEFVDCALEELDPGELVVRVAYSDVNYKDALAATGKGRILLRPSCIGGIDLAGHRGIFGRSALRQGRRDPGGGPPARGKAPRRLR
jgi:hypothetical protein